MALSTELLPTYLKFHILTTWTTQNCNALHESDNLSPMVILNYLVTVRLAHADMHVCSQGIP